MKRSCASSSLLPFLLFSLPPFLAMFDEHSPGQALAMQSAREPLGTEATDEDIADGFRNALAETVDVDTRRALLSQVARAPSVLTLALAVDWMKKDTECREAAARAAAEIGSNLAGRYRAEVKRAMQQVIATSENAETVRLADVALRDASRSVNLALHATASSPDDCEPDGGSGPDSAAVDGDRATYWDEIDNQPVYRLQVKFDRPTNANTLVIVGHAYQSHSPKDFLVICDQRVVKSVADAQYDPRTNETLVSFPRCECSVLELKITGYYGGSPGIRELEIYDVETGTEPTQYVPLPAGPPKLSWRREEGSVALLNYSRVVWALHFDPGAAKPYFDPLGLLDGTSLVWKSPSDHPWHHAFWFAWKGINGVNYWEEDVGTGRAEGSTEVTKVEISTSDSFSARVDMALAYHRPGEQVVLRETRVLRISAPDDRGRYTIDWQSRFRAGEQDVLLQGGTAGGGYAGLSARITPESRDWRLIDDQGREDVPGPDPLAKNLHGKHARALDFSLVQHGSGEAAGLAILEHPTSLRHPTQWHCVLEDKIPFGYFSPSPLWSQPYTLGAGEEFCLAYRIIVHPQRITAEELQRMWNEYAAAKGGREEGRKGE